MIILRFHLATLFLILIAIKRSNTSGRMLGGLSGTKAATAAIQKLIDRVHDDAEGRANQIFEEYIAISFRRQVVNGMNYCVKVYVGNGKYIHLRIYEPLPYTGKPPELSAIQLNKTADDEITYF